MWLRFSARRSSSLRLTRRAVRDTVPGIGAPVLPHLQQEVAAPFPQIGTAFSQENCILKLFAVCCPMMKIQDETPMKCAPIRIRFVLLLIIASIGAVPAYSQLAPPNDAGVTMGHIHLAVKDLEAQKHFWTATMGGIAVQNGPLSLIQFPGVYIMLRQAEPSGPPVGSIVDHFGFVWKDLPSTLAKWKADNVEVEQSGNPNQGYVRGPDGIRVEFFGDPSLPVPLQMNHIHFYPVDIPAMQAWYAKVFGGLPGKRARVSSPGWIDCDDLPGVNLSFSQGKSELAPTKGRSLDHIGFDVKNLDAFVMKLEKQGIKLDAPVRQIPNSRTKVAFLTDPWGTYIELTEGLGPATN